MATSDQFLAVLIAVVCFMEASHCEKLPPGIRKCTPGDDECLGTIYTLLIQNSASLPQFNIPNLKPYRPCETWRLQTHNPGLLQLLTFVGDGSNIRLDGIQNTRVESISGFVPNSCIDVVRAKLSIPCVTLCSYFTATVKLLNLLPFPASGDLTAVGKCIDIELCAKTQTYQRNGDQYVRLVDLTCSLDILCDFEVDFEFDTPIPVTRNVVNGLVNSHWRTYLNELRPDLEHDIGEIIYNLVSPILAKVPVKEFFIPSNKPCQQ